ncbi:MAG: hypothetical protein FVQ82_02415 [Planctomycetes bacterium]|nr:hypothetical protein [Planctomycetota bacterium]
MRSDKQKGFVLFVVVIFLMLLGLVLAILSNHLSNLTYETTAERLKVHNANLASSAFAWANQNKQVLAEKSAGDTIDLEVSEMGINGGKAAITVVAIEDGKIKINLTTQCSRARVILKRTHHATIKTTQTNNQ